MTYKVTEVGDDWIDIWDGEAIVDPDIPRHKSTERVFVGSSHHFVVGDIVALMVRLVARITEPDAEVIPIQDWLTESRQDREVLNQHG